jgi:phenylacetic acid degradation operon negative regulatory protein
MKLLKKKILFALNSEENLSYQSYSFLYLRLSEFEKGSIRDAVVRLERVGAVDKLERNGLARIRLTNLGKDILTEETGGRDSSNTSWDKRWRLVILDGTGKQHRALLSALRQLSYRRVARGAYVSPLPVSESTGKLFLQKKWTNLAQVIESRRLILGDDRQWARRLWNLDKLGSQYETFVTLANRLLKMSRKNNMLLKQSKGGFKEVFDRWFFLYSIDPRLPTQLLPPDWPAGKAKELFERLVVLAKTAEI